MAVAAGVVGDGQIAAALAANVQVSAQAGGAAAFDIPHGLVLRRGEAMVLAVLRAMAAKDLGHLQGWSGHRARRYEAGWIKSRGLTSFWTNRSVMWV